MVRLTPAELRRVRGRLAAILAFSVFVMVLFPEIRKQPRAFWGFTGFVLLSASLAIGCGGGSSSSNNMTTSTSYVVTVTGTANSGTLQHTVQIVFTVQ
jgi:hypothetical protein